LPCVSGGRGRAKNRFVSRESRESVLDTRADCQREEETAAAFTAEDADNGERPVRGDGR
jgi:hypothetical protein